MKSFKTTCFNLVAPVFLSGLGLAAGAQAPAGIQPANFTQPVIKIPDAAKKLPNIQSASLRAPTNIKTNGSAAGDNDFQAYNRATDVFYTIANDDDELYFILRAVDPGIIKRITTRGITFMLNRAGKKTDKEAIIITYPVYNKNDRPIINLVNIPAIQPGSTGSEMKADSFMNAN